MNLKDVVHKIDIEAESRMLSNEEIEIRHRGYKEIIEKEKNTVLYLQQKSRIKWAIEGDKNTRFFHGYFNNNNRKNRINGLLINGE